MYAKITGTYKGGGGKGSERKTYEVAIQMSVESSSHGDLSYSRFREPDGERLRMPTSGIVATNVCSNESWSL